MVVVVVREHLYKMAYVSAEEERIMFVGRVGISNALFFLTYIAYMKSHNASKTYVDSTHRNLIIISASTAALEYKSILKTCRRHQTVICKASDGQIRRRLLEQLP